MSVQELQPTTELVLKSIGQLNDLVLKNDSQLETHGTNGDGGIVFKDNMASSFVNPEQRSKP